MFNSLFLWSVSHFLSSLDVGQKALGSGVPKKSQAQKNSGIEKQNFFSGLKLISHCSEPCSCFAAVCCSSLLCTLERPHLNPLRCMAALHIASSTGQYLIYGTALSPSMDGIFSNPSAFPGFVQTNPYSPLLPFLISNDPSSN